MVDERIRSYREGDTPTFVGLWNRANAGYGGYIPRTVPYWEWCILQRPGLSPDDILVLEQEDAVLGYAVLGPQGKVLELAIEPTLPRRRRRRLAASLCEALEDHARARGDQTIRFMVPSTDAVICEALRANGYAEEAGDFLNMTIVNPVALIRSILHSRAASIPRSWTPSFQLVLAPGYYRFSPQPDIHITIADPPVVQESAPSHAANYRVQTDLSVLTDLIFNRLSFAAAIEAGSLVVEPASGLSQAQRLMDLIVLHLPWYSPYADAR